MTRIANGLIAGLIVALAITPTWGGPPPNPTDSDDNGNTAGGTAALQSLTDGIVNTAFGRSALFSNTTGNFNSAGGVSTLSHNTTGSRNTATGAFALIDNTTGDENTAAGASALGSNTTGSFNSATGVNALFFNTVGEDNTATGHSALVSNTTGSSNTAAGADALQSNIGGDENTAAGSFSLANNATGSRNTAIGFEALRDSTGNQNVAVGHGAGAALESGNRNIYLGHPGVASESRTMRLGSSQTRTFIAGVASTGVFGDAVRINANGQLGVQVSSARYKRNIEPMGTSSDGVFKLRPVTYVYNDDDQGTRQYGLIAEEVVTVYPELVTRTETGDVQGVRYEELIPMLLNELQRQQRELTELRNLVGELQSR